jgi:hypothetical protein
MKPVTVKVIVFWIVMPCSLENINLPFVGKYCLACRLNGKLPAITVKKAAPFCTFL